MNCNIWTTTLITLVLAPALACSDDGGDGTDDLADATVFTIGVEHIAPAYPYFASGSFDTPAGASQAGPLLSGDSYTVEFHAPPGTRLSFATMFVPSNDLFFAPSADGIALFDDQGQPLSGEVTDQVQIWDAGTELDEDLGLGTQQAPSQSGPNTGDDDPNPNVRLASEGYANLPAVAELIGVTLSAGDGNMFTLTIDNRSDDQSLVRTDATTSAVPLAPGVFVIHGEPNPLFTLGQPVSDEGLEGLAEDGDPSLLSQALGGQSGLVSPLAPGVWMVHAEGEQLFEVGQPDPGLGLEGLAEDGSPDVLLDSYAGLNVGIFGGLYDDEIAPLEPGNAFLFDVEARPGERLSFTSMFVQSNDQFLALAPEGVALFDADGTPLSGDISAQILLWDLGTEINEYPGAGPNQAPRQAGPNTGLDEDGLVQPVGTDFEYPNPMDTVRVTIMAN